MNPSFKTVLKAALVLGLFSILGTGAVALVYQNTEQRITANERAALLRSLEALLPADLYDNDIISDTLEVVDEKALGTPGPVTVYRARKGDRNSAAVLTPVAPDGYNGAIKLLVAIRSNGTLLGVRVVSHKETPGLGDAIEESRSQWIESFTGRSLQDPGEKGWAVKRDGGAFDQFTGATITPRAVVNSVYRTLVYFRQHKEELFSKANPRTIPKERAR